MLDQQDLQAIAKLLDEKISASEARMSEQIKDSEARVMAYVEEKISDSQAQTVAMMEAYFEPKFSLLGEQLSLFRAAKASAEALEDLESRVDVLGAAVKQHSREIEALKKAQ